MYRSREKRGEISTESDIFLEIGGNLKQGGGMHHCFRGDSYFVRYLPNVIKLMEKGQSSDRLSHSFPEKL